VVVGNLDGINVIVDSDGQLGTSNSSRRFKKDIKPMDQTSEVILARDADGQPLTVRYDVVNAMLLNEFLKEHKKVEEQQTNITQLNAKMANQAALIAQQQKGMELLTAQLKEQAAQIQKVSAQLEVNKPAQQVVSHKQ
jgi:uncharacterized coiled-coil protein SlyX